MEQLANLYASTLSAGYTAGAGIIHVTTGAGLPSVGGGQFALTVLDQSTLAVKVIFRAAYLGGTAVAVTAETGDTNCNSGDIVVATMLTARSVPSILQDWLGYGPTSLLPSVTGRKLGMRYKVNDGNFEYIFDDGSNNSPATSPLWVPYFRGIQTAIPNQSFSWINQNSATVATEADGSILLTGTNNGSIQARVFAAPSTPYKFKFIIHPYLPFSGFPECAVCFTDGTKFASLAVFTISASGLATPEIVGDHWNTISSFNANFGQGRSGAGIAPLVLGLGDDGTNRNYYIYPDGYTEILYASESRTNFLTATEIGFYYNDNGSSGGGAIVLNGLERTV